MGKILIDYDVQIPHDIVHGGAKRYHSVKNVLNVFPFEQDSLIGIHDIVRPFVSKKTIADAYNGAEICGACAPVQTPVKLITVGRFKLNH